MRISDWSSDVCSSDLNGLIREGATLIQNAADVMEAIGPMGGGLFRQRATSFDSAPVSADASNQERQDALQLLSLTPTPVDELIRQSGLSPAVVQTVLLELELAGRLERQDRKSTRLNSSH